MSTKAEHNERRIASTLEALERIAQAPREISAAKLQRIARQALSWDAVEAAFTANASIVTWPPLAVSGAAPERPPVDVSCHCPECDAERARIERRRDLRRAGETPAAIDADWLGAGTAGDPRASASPVSVAIRPGDVYTRAFVECPALADINGRLA